MANRALLVLADGTTIVGTSFAAEGERIGEVVFNTSLTGYQEILTDPSYTGQIVVMTYPHIGNYGVNPEDVESRRPFVEGIVVREACPRPSNWRSTASLADYLRQHGIPGISGIDTRALTRHLRDAGAMMGILSTVDLDPQSLLAKVQTAPSIVGRDLVRMVTCPLPYAWDEGMGSSWGNAVPLPQWTVVVYDFGVKYTILRSLRSVGCSVCVVPATTPAEQVLAMRPDGVVLSNGPGDPSALPYACAAVRGLLGRVPIFGICLGHQILGLALGGRTYKLKFGHHAGNHPVKNLQTGAVEITAQNHGFAVDLDSIPGHPCQATHISLNDGTIEGMAHRSLPAFSVQYHPEASPGPHDSRYLFDAFIRMMADWHGREAPHA